MGTNLSSQYHPIPTGSVAYDYGNPAPPFQSEDIAAIDVIKEFLSDRELAQVRRLETVYYSTVFESAVGTFIPGLRSYDTSFCLYLCRFNASYYEDLLEDFLGTVKRECPEADLVGITRPWFRAATPEGDRYYPLQFHGNLQAWKDCMFAAASKRATTMAWFERGKFCLTDGRKLAFGDLQIDRLKGGEPIPQDW